jgi:hypothetical protein
MLSSTIDDFKFEQYSSNAKLEELSKPHGNAYFEISSLDEAKSLCLEFINHFNLGMSNWSGGRVVDENSNFIANISYNGRVWDNENFNKAKGIII